MAHGPDNSLNRHSCNMRVHEARRAPASQHRALLASDDRMSRETVHEYLNHSQLGCCLSTTGAGCYYLVGWPSLVSVHIRFRTIRTN